VIEEMMEDAVPTEWVSDLFTSQMKAASKFHQLCMAHQIRDLTCAIDGERSG